ncbi:MAG TPA: hypothetical protein PLW27_01810 [Kiritimatiellia bacterium]|nr:hypothetical protein [Kiritimatiellia bacterium]
MSTPPDNEKKTDTSWSVTVMRDPAAQPPPPPKAGGSWSVKIDREAAAASKPDGPSSRSGKPGARAKAAHARLATAPGASPAQDLAAPPASAGTRRRPVVVRHDTDTAQHRPAQTAQPPASSSITPFVLPAVIVLALAALIGLAGMKIAAQKKRERAAVAQAQAAVNAHLGDIQAMLAHAPAHGQKLDAAILDLQAALADTPAADVFQERVNAAIHTVRSAEKQVLDADTAGESISGALARLNGQSGAVTLVQQIDTAHASGKKQQSAIEGKCQILRDLIMNANARLPATRKGRR